MTINELLKIRPEWGNLDITVATADGHLVYVGLGDYAGVGGVMESTDEAEDIPVLVFIAE